MSEVKSADIKKALAKRHGEREFFFTECKNGPTGTGMLQFDGLAIYKSWAHPLIVGYEIKISRSDFLRDAKYTRYLQYCHEFYFVTPTSMVQRQEIEESIGLIWYNPANGALTTKKKAIYRDIDVSANMLLYIIMTRLDGDRYPFHSDREEYWNDWLENKIRSKELGRRVKSKLLQTLSNLEDDKRRTGSLEEIKTNYEALIKVMRKHGIKVWCNTAEKLDDALSREYPHEIDTIRDQLENAIKEIDKMKIKTKESEHG